MVDPEEKRRPPGWPVGSVCLLPNIDPLIVCLMLTPKDCGNTPMDPPTAPSPMERRVRSGLGVMRPGGRVAASRATSPILWPGAGAMEIPG